MTRPREITKHFEMRLHLSCSLHCDCQDVTGIPTKAFLICYIHLYGKLWDSQ